MYIYKKKCINYQIYIKWKHKKLIYIEMLNIWYKKYVIDRKKLIIRNLQSIFSANNSTIY